MIQSEMHVISRSTLREFWRRHPESEAPLTRWYRILRRSNFEDFNHLRATFPSADWVQGFVIFNIGGNKFRLITAIHFNRGKVYIRHVMTHDDYDRGSWKS